MNGLVECVRVIVNDDDDSWSGLIAELNERAEFSTSKIKSCARKQPEIFVVRFLI